MNSSSNVSNTRATARWPALGLGLSTALATLATLAAGCGDITSSTGELGMITYTLSTDYEVPQGELTAASIVTGYAQTISTGFTEKGEDKYGEETGIYHVVSPSTGVTLNQSSGSPPSFDILVDDPGSYEISAYLPVQGEDEDELVDKITLTFDEPTALELAVRYRLRNEDGFNDVYGTGPTAVDEGSQLAFVLIPIRAGNERLAGDFSWTYDVSPSWAVAEGQNVDWNFEDNIGAFGKGGFTLYMIEPGTVTVTFEDTVHHAQGSHTFTVTAVPH